MGVRLTFGYQQIIATICFAIFTFCILRYFEPAEAANLYIEGKVSIPSIGLNSDVAKVSLVDGVIPTPDYIVGSYSRHQNKTLLIGHSTTSFSELDNVKIGDVVYYNDSTYVITKAKLTEKNQINMKDVLSSEKQDTIILMTCAGDIYSNGDASHRLMIYATISD